MKIAVICEVSSADKNADILAALQGRGHEIINAGMKDRGAKPELSYIHSAILSAILLNLKRVDYVVGGCGTGQGFLNAIIQFPNVFCGHICNPLDAWLFTQINGGNCISLMLNQNYGWAGEVNLRFIFDSLLSVEWGGGYPDYRREPQKEARIVLEELSRAVHPSFAEVISSIPDELLQPVLRYPGVMELIDVPTIEDSEVKAALENRLT